VSDELRIELVQLNNGAIPMSGDRSRLLKVGEHVYWEGRRADCACRKSNPDILVVQPAENWAAKNVPGPLDGARDRGILLQG
jgi:hypothetical protein